MAYTCTWIMTLITVWILILQSATVVSARTNVLFLVADDMRAEVGAYNNDGPTYNPDIHTPNLDQLAGRSLVLKNAFVQLAMCTPSRTSLMTGRRPDTTRVYDLQTYWRDVSGNYTTIPQYFKENGYETGGIGKIFHHYKASGYDDPLSWTLDYGYGVKNFESSSKSWEAIDDALLDDKPLIDQQVASQAVQRLQVLSAAALSGQKPFFLAVGFYKPHLPFVFPASMLEHYPEDSVSLPDNPYVPENLPPRAWQIYNELRSYDDMSSYSGKFNTTLPDNVVYDLRRAYYASVSYIDEQIGRVLQELDNLGLANNTIVSFLGDHGFHLGEHAQWCKLTNFDEALRAPMMIHVPERTECGVVSKQVTEFVDIFPTLVEAAELPSVNQCGDNSKGTVLCTEGTSLLPLVTVPSAPIKVAAFSQTPRNYFNLMGYTMRTAQYRYTEWIEFDYVNSVPRWDSPSPQRELYDHNADPGENNNIVSDRSDLAARLSKQLRLGWRGALVDRSACMK